MTRVAPGWRHHYAIINNIQMHYVEQAAVAPAAVQPAAAAAPGRSRHGVATGKPAVVLCHGFPMLWFSWHRQIVVFTDEGEVDQVGLMYLEKSIRF